MKTFWKILVIFMVLTGLTISSCNLLSSSSSRQQGINQSSGTNGEQIYFTGADAQGDRITYTGGPNFGGMMMGGYLTCAACHGPDAHGGEHFMHMQVMDAPPIYYEALNSMLVEESGGTQTAEGYTLEDFRTSVIEGQHPDGDELSLEMPRWKMSDADLADLFAFLKTIPK